MQNSRPVVYFLLLDFGGDLVVVLVIVVQAVVVKCERVKRKSTTRPRPKTGG